MRRRIPRPNQIRAIDGSFAWIDHRLIRDGFLERMTLEEIAVYVFLVLAADRYGMSWYRKNLVADALGIDWEKFEFAKKRLIEKDLIAFDPYRPGQVDGVYQVLALPGAACGDA